MKDETINDLLIRAGAMLRDAEGSAHKFNDSGGVHGFDDESCDIRETLRRALHDCCRRSRRLIRRIEKYDAGEREAELLHSIDKE